MISVILASQFLVASVTWAKQSCLHDLRTVFNQAEDHFRSQEYLMASQPYAIVAQLSCDPTWASQARFRWGQSFYELGEKRAAREIIKPLLKDPKFSDPAQVAIAWYEPGLKSDLNEKLRFRFSEFDQAIKALPNAKVPWVAGTLSAAVPGLGQVYNGTYQSAAMAFALNFLFLSATVEMADRNLDATATAAGAIFSFVYVGNILSAVSSAKKLNHSANQEARQNLQSRFFPELNP